MSRQIAADKANGTVHKLSPCMIGRIETACRQAIELTVERGIDCSIIRGNLHSNGLSCGCAGSRFWCGETSLMISYIPKAQEDGRKGFLSIEYLNRPVFVVGLHEGVIDTIDIIDFASLWYSKLDAEFNKFCTKRKRLPKTRT